MTRAVALAAMLGACASPAQPDAGTADGRGDPVREQLYQALAAASMSPPPAGEPVRVTYIRGHELYGMTTLEVDRSGHYTLASNHTAEWQPFSWTGTLSETDRAAWFRSLVEHRILDAVSTPRPFGNDVVPVRIDVVRGSLSMIVLLSDEDARRDPTMRAFETTALELARRLSGGVVTHQPD